MSRINTDLKVQHWYVCGGSGTGKSASVKQEIKKQKRVIVYDPDDEYTAEGLIRFTSAKHLLANLAEFKKKPFKCCFVPNAASIKELNKAFDFFAAVTMAWGDCFAVAEEIADVTGTGKAVNHWGALVRRGRKYNIKIAAVTQRPAEADKTILTQAAIIRCHQLGRINDKKAVAAEMNIALSHINKLRPLDYIEFTRADLSVKSGNLNARNKKIIPTLE